MHIETPALVCALLAHGENGVIVRALSEDHGLLAGYVRGGRSRRLRPVLQPGNVVAMVLAARVETQLASATVELIEPRAPLASTGAALAALEWTTALTAAALPEEVPHPALHAALDGLTRACAEDAGALALAEAVVRYELLLMADLGFGLDLSCCAATGSRSDLAYVSPKSSQAVSRTAGAPWAAKLLPLPGFLTGREQASAADVRDGLALTGHFLARNVLTGRAAGLFAARERLVTRLPAPTMVDETGTPG
ncbi:DNA repair protein RecO [Polymorphobacter sp.]|uniref:DNA repair protein RecO n=1 Tax=Polymorphobacter sp. TaxID=1909290 RepID=UPI003F6E5EEF